MLIERNFSERVFENGITRRLFSIFLRYELDKDEFIEKCEILESFCWQRISDPALQSPEKWFVEALFQHIQKHAHSISDPLERRKIRENFFSAYLPQALSNFMQSRGKDKWKEDKSALAYWLERDWEFSFTINYYLRGTEYNADPVQKFQQQISQFDD